MVLDIIVWKTIVSTVVQYFYGQSKHSSWGIVLGAISDVIEDHPVACVHG